MRVSQRPKASIRREERFDECVGIEGLRVGWRFAGSHEFHGDIGDVANSNDDTALGSAVELGEKDPGDAGGLVEFFGLSQRVLSGRGVEDEDDFVRSAGDVFGGDVADLGELPHERVLSLQPARGVEDENVYASRACGGAGVKGDGGGISALLAFDHINAQSSGPGFELGDCAGPECVAGAEKNSLALFAEEEREFGDAGGFANAVDAGHQDHGGAFAGRCHSERSVGGGPHRFEFSLEILKNLFAAFHFPGFVVGADAFDESGGSFDAHIGLKEPGFEFGDEGIVETSAQEERSQARDARDECLPGFFQPLLELVDDGLEERHGWRGLCGRRGVGFAGFEVMKDFVEQTVDERG